MKNPPEMPAETLGLIVEVLAEADMTAVVKAVRATGSEVSERPSFSDTPFFKTWPASGVTIEQLAAIPGVVSVQPDASRWAL